jgi:1,4-dihydroxy-2-naphthoate octaprenyltransferase
MIETDHLRRGVGVWIEAGRPRTLVAGVVPVLVGTAAAGRFIAWRFACALLVGVAIQVAVNYANDYFDGTKGIDSETRVGPRRAVAAGLVTPGQMKRAISLALLAACIPGIALALVIEPWLIAVGVACIGAALGYSGGPRPYGALGLGELFVFVFFGLVATIGSAYVQVERLQAEAVAAAVPVGLLAVAILVVNNLRDIDTDRAAGKITLAVRLGSRTRLLYELLIWGALASTVVVVATAGSLWPLIALASVPLGLRARHSLASGPGPATFVATAALHGAYGSLLAIGLWVA